MNTFNMGTVILKEGELTKLRDRGIHMPPFLSRCVKRYFVLRREGFTGSFRYYLDECKSPRGRIKKTYDLDECTQVDAHLKLADSTCVNTYTFFHWIFCLHITKPSNEKRTELYLVAKDEVSMQDWVDMLCRVCHLEQQPSSNTTVYTYNDGELPSMFHDMSISSGRSIDSLLDPPLSDVTSESKTGKDMYRNQVFQPNTRAAAMSYLHMRNSRNRSRLQDQTIVEMPLIERKSNGSSRKGKPIKTTRRSSSASGCSSAASSQRSRSTDDDGSSVHSNQSNTIISPPPVLKPRSMVHTVPIQHSASLLRPTGKAPDLNVPLPLKLPTENGEDSSGDTIKILPMNNRTLPSNFRSNSSLSKAASMSKSSITTASTGPFDGPPVDRSKKPANLSNLRLDSETDNDNNKPVPMQRTPQFIKKGQMRRTLDPPKSAGHVRRDLDYFEPPPVSNLSKTLDRPATSCYSRVASGDDYIQIDAEKTQALQKVMASSSRNSDY